MRVVHSYEFSANHDHGLELTDMKTAQIVYNLYFCD